MRSCLSKVCGSRWNAFEPIVACGSNATILHYIDNHDKLSKNELVLIDTGAMNLQVIVGKTWTSDFNDPSSQASEQLKSQLKEAVS